MALALATLPAASAQETIRFAVTDNDGMEALQREMRPLNEALEAASGLTVEVFAVSGRTVAVEATAADQVDFVLTGPAEYVAFNARLAAQPVGTWVRPDYYSTMVVLDDSPVESPVDLKGQKVSFGDIGSTSQHLGPVALLAKAGLTYAVDYEPVFLNRNVAVEALIKGEIAGIGLNRTHIDSITARFPDQKFRVLGKGEQQQNDILLASAKVAPEVVKIVQWAFAGHGAQILAALTSSEGNARYIGGRFNPVVQDSDYDVVRQMSEAIGITEFTEFVGE